MGAARVSINSHFKTKKNQKKRANRKIFDVQLVSGRQGRLTELHFKKPNQIFKGAKGKRD